MNETLELWPLDINTLYSGLHVDFDIYYLHENTFVLLCSNVLLDEEYIRKLKKIALNSKNIYMKRENQIKLLNKPAYFRNIQKKIEDDIGYSEIKHETDMIFKRTLQTGVVDRKSAQEVSGGLAKTLSKVDQAVIIQCLNTVREVDEYLYTHSSNVALLNGLIGRWMKLDLTSMETLVKVGLLHDIGKLRVPGEVLNKPGSLNRIEFELMKAHARFSKEMLIESGETDRVVIDAVGQHHEKMNGRGYPQGLYGDQISLFARITSVSDTYDAMISKRVYKGPHSPFEILNEFSLGRFSDLDLSIVNAFLKHMPAELTGKLVLLSDGSVGRVRHVSETNLLNPIVSVDGKIVPTSASTVFCVSMLQEEMAY